jgi:hypothetical protein
MTFSSGPYCKKGVENAQHKIIYPPGGQFRNRYSILKQQRLALNISLLRAEKLK